MRKAVAFLFLLLPTFCFAQIAVQWSPADFTLYAPVAQQITITPLWSYTAFGSNVVSHESRSFSTGTIITSTGKTLPGIPGSLIVSNIIYGGYEVEFFKFNNPTPVASFTNVFTNGSPALANGNLFFGVSTNSTLKDEFAYPMSAIDAMFASFTGGSATNAFTSQVSGLGLNLATDAVHFIYTFSLNSNLQGFAQWSTNAFAALFDVSGSATASTNGYPWGTLYDATGSALASTNGLGITSGLAAFRGTNTLASTNVATASKVGLVKVDNSTITVAADGTISATTGGGGSVTSVGVTVPQGMSVSGVPITGSGTAAITFNGGNLNLAGGGISNAALIIATNQLGVGIAGGASPANTNALQVDTRGGANSFNVNSNGDAFFGKGLFVGGNATNAGTFSIAGPATNFGTATFMSSVIGNGAGLTNLMFTEATLAPSSNGTNYPVNFIGADEQYIFSANTNANVTYSSITRGRAATLYVDASTSSVPCVVTFPINANTNGGLALVVTNGTSRVFDLRPKLGTDPTNVWVTGGDVYHR